MRKLIKNRDLRSGRLCVAGVRGLLPLLLAATLLAATMMLNACGGSSSSTDAGPQVGGNWQFVMSTMTTSTPPATLFASSPLQGGLLLQENGSITGQVVFAISLPPPANGGPPINCNNGTASLTGTVSGQTVSLTATVASLGPSGPTPTTQTFTLSGQLSADGSSIKGTYGLTAGYYQPAQGVILNGQPNVPCGAAQDGTAPDAPTWSATLVPPLSGGFQGFFHSTSTNQDFPVSGTFSQGPNIAATSATVTGSVLFQDPVTLLNDFPCFGSASLNGTISGNNVLLQVFSSSGTAVGQIGQTPLSSNPPAAVTYDSTQGGGYVVHNGATGQGGVGYVITTKSCGDVGNLCLALGGSKACSQPITLTPFALTFPPQLVGSAATSQTVTLTNNTSSQLTGLTLLVEDNDSKLFYASGGDFNGVPNFTEQDTCSQQKTFTLNPSGAQGSSCVITVNFSPQESCPWLPESSSGPFVAPAACPAPLTGMLTVSVPTGSADANDNFSVPLTGTGLSRLVPSVPEIDFGWEALGEASPDETVTFTNQGPSPVTILPYTEPPTCAYPATTQPPEIPRPPVQDLVPGLQLAATTATLGLAKSSGDILPQNASNPPLVLAPTVDFFCESDPPRSAGGSGLPNIQVSDGCSGQTLTPFGQPGNSCSIKVTFVPQPATWSAAVHANTGLDDFLQLNSMWCGDANNPAEPNCEIDSGRFPVEIKTNPPSPLRMFPSAGMDFGSVVKGTGSNPLSITLFNDPVDPNAGTVNFTAKLVTGADYIESDTCPPTLASNQSCTVTVQFAPTIVGLDPGKITFTYNTPTQTVAVQTIYLRGTGM
ncbi:MAG: choice-of-anchor D domain-containing protein [Terriglobales bacterium]